MHRCICLARQDVVNAIKKIWPEGCGSLIMRREDNGRFHEWGWGGDIWTGPLKKG